jgi:hypothetical protein
VDQAEIWLNLQVQKLLLRFSTTVWMPLVIEDQCSVPAQCAWGSWAVNWGATMVLSEGVEYLEMKLAKARLSTSPMETGKLAV